MKNLKTGFVAAVLVALAVLFYLQHQLQEKLRADNAALAQSLAQVQTDNESLSNRLASVGDANSLSDKEHNELLKLRGEVGLLRRQTNELGKLREENQKLHDEFANEIPKSLPSPEQAEFNMHRVYTVNAMKQLGLAMRIFAGDHNEQYATNFDQLKNELGGVTNFTGNIALDSIEFVNVGLVNDSMPDKIMFREQTPRQNPGGGWERIYGLSDGSVQTITSSDGNFDFYEQPHMVSPP